VESHFLLLFGESYGQQLFSVQQVLSCVSANFSAGCGGGDTLSAFEYLSEAPGLAQSDFWPYSQGLLPKDRCDSMSCTQSCNFEKLSQTTSMAMFLGYFASVTGARFAIAPCMAGDCDNQDLKGLAFALTEVGPLSISVNAETWSHYVGGVLSYEGCGNSSADSLDHAVQLVGFNSVGDEPYWIVRNSWGTIWGQAGYIYLEFGRNTCGLANDVSYPALGNADNETLELQTQRFDAFYQRAQGQRAMPLKAARSFLVFNRVINHVCEKQVRDRRHCRNRC